jgi:hypothetical protein
LRCCRWILASHLSWGRWRPGCCCVSTHCSCPSWCLNTSIDGQSSRGIAHLHPGRTRIPLDLGPRHRGHRVRSHTNVISPIYSHLCRAPRFIHRISGPRRATDSTPCAISSRTRHGSTIGTPLPPTRHIGLRGTARGRPLHAVRGSIDGGMRLMLERSN